MEPNEFAKIVICKRVDLSKVHIRQEDEKKEIFEFNFVKYHVTEPRLKQKWLLINWGGPEYDSKKEAKIRLKKAMSHALFNLNMAEMENVLREFKFKELLL